MDIVSSLSYEKNMASCLTKVISRSALIHKQEQKIRPSCMNTTSLISVLRDRPTVDIQKPGMVQGRRCRELPS